MDHAMILEDRQDSRRRPRYLALLGSVALAALVAVALGRRASSTPANQLREFASDR
jgi:hypothetical protein